MANEGVQKGSQGRGLEEVGVRRRERRRGGEGVRRRERRRGGEGVRRVRERDEIGRRVGRKGN